MNHNLNGPSLGRAWHSDYNKSEKKNGNDEIDLFELFLNGLSLIDRYKALIVSLPVLSVCLGILWFAITPLRHEGQLICKVPGMDKSLVHQMLSAIFEKEGGISKELEGVSSLELVDGEMTDGTFVVSASVNDPAHLSTLQKIIVEYFESDEYVRSARDRERNRIESTIYTLRQEEQRLASVIEQVVVSRNSQGEAQSIADLSKLKMDFYKERLSLENQLDNLTSIQIIQGFSKTTRPADKSLVKYVLTFLAGGCALTVMIIFAGEARRLVKENRYLLKNPSI